MNELLGVTKVPLLELRSQLAMTKATELAKTISHELADHLDAIEGIRDSIRISEISSQLTSLQEAMTPLRDVVDQVRSESMMLREHIAHIRDLSGVYRKFDEIHTDIKFAAAVKPLDDLLDIGMNLSRDVLRSGEEVSVTQEDDADTTQADSVETQESIQNAQNAALVEAVTVILELIGLDRYFLRFYAEVMTSKDASSEEIDEARWHLLAAIDAVIEADDDGDAA